MAESCLGRHQREPQPRLVSSANSDSVLPHLQTRWWVRLHLIFEKWPLIMLNIYIWNRPIIFCYFATNLMVFCSRIWRPSPSSTNKKIRRIQLDLPLSTCHHSLQDFLIYSNENRRRVTPTLKCSEAGSTTTWGLPLCDPTAIWSDPRLFKCFQILSRWMIYGMST